MQRGIRDVALDAFRILLGGFRRHPERQQQVHHQAVARVDLGGQPFPASVRNTPR